MVGKKNIIKLFIKDDNVIKAEFLKINELYEAIDLQIYRNSFELEYLRIQLWWTMNDKFRYNINIEFDENEKKMYGSNCLELINLLDKNDINEKIMIAELNRNIGNFNTCKEITNQIKDEKFKWMGIILKNECSKNNKKWYYFKISVAFPNF